VGKHGLNRNLLKTFDLAAVAPPLPIKTKRILAYIKPVRPYSIFNGAKSFEGGSSRRLEIFGYHTFVSSPTPLFFIQFFSLN